MFKIFKKLHHTRNLIYANQDGNIIFSEDLPYKITNMTEDIIINNMLYDDKIYKAIYKEYKRNYPVYDRHPLLLYFRIPILIQAQYVHVKLVEANDYLLTICTISKEIPEVFRIPKLVKETILECLKQSLPYMANNVDMDDFERYLEFKFLSEWPYYIKHHDEYIDVFSNTVLSKFIKAGGSNSQTISNIIGRVIKNNLNEASSN